MTPILVFDIETVPDFAGSAGSTTCRPSSPTRDVAEIAFQQRRAQTGQRLPAAAPAARRRDLLRAARREGLQACGRSASPSDGEGGAIQRFFDGIEKYTPQLVSWNGGGFDLPVLHYRGLIHGVARRVLLGHGRRTTRTSASTTTSAATTTRHLDLMDLLALYAGRGCAARRARAARGLPGQARHGRLAGVGGYRAGELAAIRNYCETDASTPISCSCASS